MNKFKELDKNTDLKGLQQDIDEAAEKGTGSYKEVPVGNYEVSVEKMELTFSKNGDPMVSIWFNIVNGEYKGQKIFYNQIIPQGFQIHNTKVILKKMVEELDDAPEIEFTSYEDYAELIMDVFEAIDGNFEYDLEYGKNKKGYNTFEIKEVFALD